MLQPTSIATHSYGDITLLANANVPVVLTASTGCATGTLPPSTVSVYANLNPAELDVDAGEPFGLQVQAQSGQTAVPAVLPLNSSFIMDIRVNSVSSPLIAFEVRSQADT